MSDTTLQRDIMQALADSPHVHPDEVSAQVVGRDVILHGTVGSIVQRDEAGVATAAVPGVRNVDNQLRVRLLDGDRRADVDTAAAVMDALTADPELHAATLDVEASDGAVTLRGYVPTTRERDRAEWIARAVPGVTAVRNRLGREG
jgi:hyperosmotically inducible periplasmic protein